MLFILIFLLPVSSHQGIALKPDLDPGPSDPVSFGHPDPDPQFTNRSHAVLISRNIILSKIQFQTNILGILFLVSLDVKMRSRKTIFFQHYNDISLVGSRIRIRNTDTYRFHKHFLTIGKMLQLLINLSKSVKHENS